MAFASERWFSRSSPLLCRKLLQEPLRYCPFFDLILPRVFSPKSAGLHLGQVFSQVVCSVEGPRPEYFPRDVKSNI